MLAFKDIGGKSTANKDKDSRELCAINLTDVLTGYGTTISTVTVPESAGTTADGQPTIQGNLIIVWVIGGDANLDQNYVTVRYTLANGVIKDKTLYFKIVEE